MTMVGKRLLTKLRKVERPSLGEPRPLTSTGVACEAVLSTQAGPGASTSASPRVGKYGLFPLHTSDIDVEHVEYALDIVAVHGITGDAYRTWTAENGKLWLRDFLPAQLPGARIFSYGYPAEVFYSKSTASLDDYARKLLEDLKSVRSGSKDQSRKIMFVCHSMGGLVVKKALVVARIDSVDYGTIRSAICAILFFGTPHRGSELASTGLALGRIYKIANLPISGFAGNTRTDLVQGLVKDSQLVVELSRDVRNQLTNVNVACFVEKANMPPLNTVIVDEATAIMGIPGERIIPMHGKNHRQICQFSDETSSDFKGVLEVIKNWATNVREEKNKLNKEDIACLRSLSFPEMDSRRREAKHDIHPHTCKWIIEHEKYHSWTNQERGLLWLKGKPGSGKSTVMSFLNSKLRAEANPGLLILEFLFHGRGTSLQKSAVGMLRTFLHQAFSRGPPSARHNIKVAYREKEMLEQSDLDWHWQRHELEDMVQQTIINISTIQKILIFVDALDEAGEEAHTVLCFLHKINDQCESLKLSAKICVACRHYPILTSIIPGFEIVAEENNRKDIQLYVHDKLSSELAASKNTPDEQAWHDIEAKIANKASGLFQWAKLVTRLVSEQNREGVSWQEVRHSLEKVPHGLDAVYSHIISAVIKPTYRKRSLLMMQWVSFARRPLTVTELRYAIASDSIAPSQEVCEDSKDFVESDERMKKLIISLSGGLVEVISDARSNEYKGEKGEIVQFIHQSVNDFIQSGGSGTFSAWNGNTDGSSWHSNADDVSFLGQSHDRLCRSCINYLALPTNERSLAAFESLKDEQLRKQRYRDNYQFAEYAADNWFKHAQEAEANAVYQTHLVERDHTIFLAAWVTDKILQLDVLGGGHPRTLLHFASASNLESVVEILLQKDSQVESKDESDFTALHYAAMFKHVSIARTLLDAGADIGAKDKDEDTALNLAAQNGDLDMIKLLLNRGAAVNGNDSSSPLHHTCEAGHISVARYLLENGAQVNAQAWDGCTALQWVELRDRTAKGIIQLILDNGADVNANKGGIGSALQAASFGGRKEIVELLLDKGADINAQGGYHGSALQAASCGGEKEIVELLLDRGADINAQGGKYGSALQAASFESGKEIVELLLDRGADINAQGGTYGSALQAASFGGEKEIVELLLNKGANIHAQGGEFGSALRAASCKGEKEIIALLLDREADINAQGGEFGSALAAA